VEVGARNRNECRLMRAWRIRARLVARAGHRLDNARWSPRDREGGWCNRGTKRQDVGHWDGVAAKARCNADSNPGVCVAADERAARIKPDREGEVESRRNDSGGTAGRFRQ
jgi:hypothetical protein